MADAELLALTSVAVAIPWGLEHQYAHISGRRNPVQRCLLLGETPAHDNAFVLTFAAVSAQRKVSGAAGGLTDALAAKGAA
jgi:hypothetical protein